MSSILVTTFGSYGDINPYVGLAVELQRRGHSVVIATSATYRSYVEAHGVEFRAVRPDADPKDAELVARIMDPFRGTEYLLKDLIIPTVRESYEDLSAAARAADLIVTHPITFAGPIVATQRGLPWVSTVLAPVSFFSRHDLPVFPPAPWLKRMERFGAWPSRLLVDLARAMTRSWSEPIFRLREELGLPRGEDPVFDGQHSPQLVLALFSPLLGEPQADWPPNVAITGHIFHTGPPHQSLDPDVEEFLAGGEPPVVFTLGSAAVHAPGDFFQETLQVVSDLGLRAILLTGTSISGDQRVIGGTPELPASVLVTHNQPYDLLFPRASAMVHHGGIGTTGQAMRAGRPMLVVPFAHDQPDNADRVRRLGIAEVLPARRYGRRSARRLLRALLSEERYGGRAREIGMRVREENGAVAAADLIERRLPR